MKRSHWLLIALTVGGTGWFFLRNDQQENAFGARYLATRALGEYLAANYEGRRALIVSNPFVPLGTVGRHIKHMEQAGISGLQKALAPKVASEVVYPELTMQAQVDPHGVLIDNETTTPLSYLVTDKSFDELAAKHPQTDVIISLIGLPANLDDVQCWKTNGKPVFALLLPDLRVIGNSAAVVRAVKDGKLVAFVLNRPDAPDSRASVRGNWRQEFDRRFLLVTAANIDQTALAYPQLFPAK